jgi:hypothetical protein
MSKRIRFVVAFTPYVVDEEPDPAFPTREFFDTKQSARVRLVEVLSECLGAFGCADLITEERTAPGLFAALARWEQTRRERWEAYSDGRVVCAEVETKEGSPA